MSKIVTIDLGSNSFRVLIYDSLNHRILDEYNQVVGLADGLVNTNEISQAALKRVIEAINNSNKKLNYDVKKAIGVTTAAMRMAKNSKDILHSIFIETGLKLTIIDGLEEARLTLLAIKYALKREKINTDKFVLLDIGGGSTEIIVNNGINYDSRSFNLGIVTLAQQNPKEDIFKYLEVKKIEINNFLDSLDIDINEYTFVATAGTPTTIAAMKLGQDFFNYDKNKVNGSTVTLDDLEDSLEIFRNSSIEEITKLVGIGRVDFIEVGIYIYRTIFEVLKKDSSIVLDDGLREGVAVNYSLQLASD